MAQISIIIPVYNSERHLSSCLDSVLAQTFEDWEAICINDGGTDGSGEVLADYAARDSRIRVFTQENCGLGVTRNRGITEACGRYVAFLDSDDMLYPEFLEQLYIEAQRSEADVVMGSTRYESPEKVWRDAVPAAGVVLNAFLERITALPHGGAWNKLYRTAFIRENDLHFAECVFWEDNLFTLQVCFKAGIFITQPAAIYRYIMRGESIVHNSEYAEKRKEDALVVLRQIMLFCDQIDCSEAERANVAAFCLRNVVNIKDLGDLAYYRVVQDLLGSSVQLSACRQKALRRERRKKLCNRVKRIVTLGLCPRSKTREGRGGEHAAMLRKTQD